MEKFFDLDVQIVQVSTPPIATKPTIITKPLTNDTCMYYCVPEELTVLK